MVRLLTAMLATLEPEQPGDEAPADEVTVRERLAVLRRMVAGGLDEEVVTLTLVPGIGPKLARRLQSAGVADIEALAQATPNDLANVGRLSRERAARWIDEATRLIRSRSALRYRETGTSGTVQYHGFPADVDPYRLRRALDLKAVGEDGGMYRVTGGLEPHQVVWRQGSPQCDCLDFASGKICKHVLAVRLARGDEGLARLAQQLRAVGETASLDLFDLWFAPTTKGGAR
jgi:helicase